MWLSGFDQREALILEAWMPGAIPDAIAVSVVVTDRATGAAKRRWVTDWMLVREAGEERLNAATRR
jgi:hypothetical protein